MRIFKSNIFIIMIYRLVTYSCFIFSVIVAEGKHFKTLRNQNIETIFIFTIPISKSISNQLRIS